MIVINGNKIKNSRAKDFDKIKSSIMRSLISTQDFNTRLIQSMGCTYQDFMTVQVTGDIYYFRLKEVHQIPEMLQSIQTQGELKAVIQQAIDEVFCHITTYNDSKSFPGTTISCNYEIMKPAVIEFYFDKTKNEFSFNGIVHVDFDIN